MRGSQRALLFAVVAVVFQVTISLPVEEDQRNLLTDNVKSFHVFFPRTINGRYKRQEGGGGGEGGSGGLGEFLQNVIKDGIATTSAFESPTMFLGGFSMMMQPLPNGTDFAGQLVNMLPLFTSLIPSGGGK